MPTMLWKNTLTGETGRWPYTGKAADSMAGEAECYANCVPGMEYLMVDTTPPEEPEDESEQWPERK